MMFLEVTVSQVSQLNERSVAQTRDMREHGGSARTKLILAHFNETKQFDFCSSFDVAAVELVLKVAVLSRSCVEREHLLIFRTC